MCSLRKSSWISIRTAVLGAIYVITCLLSSVTIFNTSSLKHGSWEIQQPGSLWMGCSSPSCSTKDLSLWPGSYLEKFHSWDLFYFFVFNWLRSMRKICLTGLSLKTVSSNYLTPQLPTAVTTVGANKSLTKQKFKESLANESYRRLWKAPINS